MRILECAHLLVDWLCLKRELLELLIRAGYTYLSRVTPDRYVTFNNDTIVRIDSTED
jgi:hypothetical protein